ncbi:MAG: VanZ family protein [Acidobacteria bacterium]|nr:VanZ family protein [Acidobacteriota bacterium]
MAMIYAASSVERPPSLPGGLPDVVAHAGVYAVLSMLVLRGVVLARGTGITVAAAAAAVILAIGYGVTDEWHQSFVAGRTAEVRDVAADAVGAVAGTGLAWACAIVLGRRAASK